MAKKQKRLVVCDADLETLERIADFTRCGSPSIALSLVISRYGEAFITDWKWHGSGHSVPPPISPVSPPITPPPPNLSEPLDF